MISEPKAKGVNAVTRCDGAMLASALVRVLAPSPKAPVITVGCIQAVLPKFNFGTLILSRHIKWQ